MNQTQLLLIDPKVEKFEQAIADLDPNTKVVILEPDRDGIDQISLHLSKCYQLESVHIISHGAKGTLYLGNSILKNDNIHQYADSIQKWGKYLSAGGEILIYGCEVACGKEGREFVRQLHQLTGANIAASETLTGNASIGGNWNLEVIFGQLKSALAFTPEFRASYAGVLANIVVDTTDDVVDDSDGVISLREAIIQANSTPEDDTIQLTAGATYDLTISGSDEDAAATGDLDIVAGGGEITVISEGEEKAVIDAGGESGIGDRVFHVLEDAALQLENIEVTGGSVTYDSGGGGGIYNLGMVSISNSNISGNSGASYYASGIFNSGTLSISDSTISGNFNSAVGGIGGIENLGTLSISNSIISDNSANFYGDVGGIENSGTLSISNSTISDNFSLAAGVGGIHNTGTASISYSTISGNSSGAGYVDLGGAGGIENSGIASISDSAISGNAGSYGGGVKNSGTASISNSTISGNAGSYGGGGIFNSGTANINNSTISDNSANRGGGLENLGTASISDSTISGNAGSYGGGVKNSGTASISDSTISGNAAISNVFYGSVYGGNGGGIYNGGIYSNPGCTASVSNSTISDNSAERGAGIYNLLSTASINNSTISGNSADFGGGAIYNSGSTAIISNSTITRNEAPSDQGSGILQKTFFRRDYYRGNYSDNYYYPSTTVTSSIISGNVNSDVDSLESNNTLISGNNNLIGTGNAIDNFKGDNDQTGITDPLLADLADNGGPTFTHLPLPNSPAIDAGSNPNAFTTDQRGEPRFVGEGVDIGAVELLNSPQITGTLESDRLNGTNENNTIIGLAGNDTINGRGRDDQIIGSRGSDFLYGKDGNDTLEGRQDNDRLFGGNGNDSLLGGQGRDRINGGAGNDTLTGGASIDRFIFNTNQEFTTADVGVDTITDFVPGQDIILLDKTTFSAITSDSGTGFSLNAEFAIVTSDADAATSEAVIVYNSENGKLFYNANGIEVEFGSGGEFANLTNTASISGDDFFVRG